MVIPGHARSRHRDRCTPIAFKRRVNAGQAEIKKGQAKNAVEDQRRNEEAVGREIPRGGQVSPIGGQHSTSAEERWQSTDVCRLSGFKQSKSQG